MKKQLLLIFFLCSLISFSQSRYISATTKKVVYARDGGVCQCCGSSQSLEFDHIMPFSCGGSSEPANLQLLCQKCNRSKSNSCFCKVHDRKVGINCCDGATKKTRTTPRSGASSRTKSVEAQQCSGTTKKGNRCKNRTTNSNGRCHLH